MAQDGETIYSAARFVKKLAEGGEFSVETLRSITGELLSHEDVSTAKLVRVLEKDVSLLSVFWVMLAECIKFAGERSDNKTLLWINRVLDICIYYAVYLKEAVKRGLIPLEDGKWKRLKELAE